MRDITRFFEETAQDKVVIIGDVMLDRYQHGQIERISPEAPVPVLQEHASEAVLGGAANVAANVASLGGTTVLIGRIGDDEGGQTVRQLCADAGIVDELIAGDAVPTITKTRFVTGGQQVLRLDLERISPPLDAQLRELLARLSKHLKDAKAVIISDYNKGLFLNGLAQNVIEAAKSAGVPVVVDPKGRDFGRYSGADVITPNRSELARVATHDLESDQDMIDAARSQLTAHCIGAMLLTRSEDGLSFITPEKALHAPAEAREVFDVSGAGDTVVATFALALARSLKPEAAAQLANSAAGKAVAKRGTATVHLSELREMLRQSGDIPGRLREPIPLDVAKDAVAAWREEGLTVGFTNGCFDILHFGHASILERARALCDRLVVGLNSDASVRRLKGAARPVNPQEDRARLLLALRAVDAVIVFDDDTPLRLIETLLPDVLIKGADYTIETVVGADVVQANGGAVKLLDIEPGRSTSAIIEKSKLSGEA